jgi:hypothetical protein
VDRRNHCRTWRLRNCPIASGQAAVARPVIQVKQGSLSGREDGAVEAFLNG